jgi:hypothetical protein
MNKENMPKSDIVWLVFDLDNGHEPSKHYCWWFNTRQNARDHIKHQKKNRYAARLSGPRKCLLNVWCGLV